MKLKIFLVTIFCILFVSVSPVFASTANLDAIVGRYQGQGVKIGVAVHAVKDQKEVFSYHATDPLNPASTMKVITSAVAFTKLGGAYAYKTAFTTDRMSKGMIHNLYIQGSGDPSVVQERLWSMIKDLRVRGVREIQGDIIIDNSYFDSESFAGRDPSSSRAYNAEISAFALNFNSFAVVASNQDGVVQVEADPPTDYFQVRSTVKAAGSSLTISRTFKDNIEYVTVSGGVSDEKIKYANVSDPVLYAGTTIKWLCDQMGISFNGKILTGAAVGKKKLIVDKSKPLAQIIHDLNKYSNNFTAEMILKTLAAEKVGVPGTTEKGVPLLTAFLTEIGVTAGEYSVHNGSGLSRNNRLSANALNQTLMVVYKNNKIRSDFISSLAIAGEDGTLKSRLKVAGLQGNVKAKTGTLNDVSSLSGFMETKAKNMLAFTIMVNGAAAGNGNFFRMQQEILSELYESF